MNIKPGCFKSAPDIGPGVGIPAVGVKLEGFRFIFRILQGEGQETIGFQGPGSGLENRLQGPEVAQGIR